MPASAIGVHIEGVQGGRWPGWPVGGIRLWDNGTSWNSVQPAAGVFDWSQLDTAVATAESQGVDDITLVLAGTPEWAATTVSPGDYPAPGAASPPRDRTAWTDYVAAVAARYAGRITAYEVWNEMNLRAFWNGTPEELAALTRLAAVEIRKADPEALVVGASAGMRTDAYRVLYPRYLAALAERDWPVDALSVHTYPAAGGTPADRVKLIRRALTDIRAAGAPERLALWDTEINYGLAGPLPEDTHRDITGSKAAGWVTRTYLDSLRFGIERTYWYIQTAAPYSLLGIQTDDGSPGARGMETVSDWVVGARWEGCDTNSRLVTCRLSREGEVSTVAWADGGTATFEIPQEAVELCTAMGRCAAVEPGSRVQVAGSPVIVRLQL
ncbi:MAG: hypothetical protein R2737_14825 [Candidatus Nanopelagicales bacterium]